MRAGLPASDWNLVNAAAPTSLSDSVFASREWRLGNIYTILDDDAQLVAFVPNQAQRTFYNNLWYCNHILKARKLGFSTFIELLNLDDCLLIPNLVCGIIDYKLEDAKAKLAMALRAYDHLDDGDLHPETWRLGAAVKKAVPLLERSKESFVLGNGSRMFCDTTVRGGTVNRLHSSEIGKTSIFAPIKAEEIKTGALNSLTPGNRADIESTHEGGRSGLHYQLCQKHMRLKPEELTPIDFRFHFFPWFDDSRYAITPARSPRPELEDYFTKLKDKGIRLTPAQIWWYDRKHFVQGHAMKKEFPSTPGEAFEAIAENAILGRWMADARAEGRIADFNPEPHLPLYAFFDIGLSDFTSIWLLQLSGRSILWCDWYENNNEPASHYIDLLRTWERKRYQRDIARIFLPHDASTRDRGTGLSYVDYFNRAGITNISLIPRTPNLWVGIDHLRDLLPNSYFHKTRCDSAREKNGTEHPSGVACLEGYQRDVSLTGDTLKERPKHDEFSHTADAARYFAEAHRHGLISPSGADSRPATPNVKRATSRRRPKIVTR